MLTNPLFLVIVVSVLFLAGLSLIPLFTRPTERADEDSWKGGIFYVNRDDPALFVPKRYGIGWTLNFGNGWSWVVMVLILAAAALPIILAVSAVRHPIRFR